MSESISIQRLNANDLMFDELFVELLQAKVVDDKEIETRVRKILDQVKKHGDAGLIMLTNKLDRRQVKNVAELEVSAEQMDEALDSIPGVQRDTLAQAAKRIRNYHERQTQRSWQYEEDDGTVLGQKITPLERVGIYVPGGKASYPSSVLMNAIPARVAGVKEIIMTVPAPDGELSPMVLAAAKIAGVDRVFTVGGAQAVAALAYGTSRVPKVDKIVGPGNIYVAAAKRMVFGSVGLDMVAGPSEILVICDGKTDPDWIAMDLFSQAEHDEEAQAILISWDVGFIDRVQESINNLLPTMARREVIATSLKNRGALIEVSGREQAIALSNQIAPEHLELSVEDPQSWLDDIRHAGAIFMGRHTAEALGDYCAGPNHVLPTSATARFSSPLGVYDFQKRSSLIYCSPKGASKLGEVASVLAHGESLEAHARSAEYRIIK